MANSDKPAALQFGDVRFFVASAVTVLFAASYLVPIMHGLPAALGPAGLQMVTGFQESTKTAFIAAWSYYLGSSASSAAKDTASAQKDETILQLSAERPMTSPPGGGLG